MDETVTIRQPANDSGGGLELGRWIGRREAFGLMSGHCSAADVESLRRIKDGKLYEEMDLSWDDFCTKHLHMTRRTVDREIGYLKKFGPAFFALRQLVRITVPQYTAIAGHVSENGLRLEGAVVALLPENSEKLAEALHTLARRKEPTLEEAASRAFAATLQRLHAASASLQSLEEELDREQIKALATEVASIVTAAAGWGVVVVAR